MCMENLYTHLEEMSKVDLVLDLDNLGQVGRIH